MAHAPITPGINIGMTAKAGSMRVMPDGRSLIARATSHARAVTITVVRIEMLTVTRKSERNRGFEKTSRYASRVGAHDCVSCVFLPIIAIVVFNPPVYPRLKPKALMTGKPMKTMMRRIGGLARSTPSHACLDATLAP